MFSVDSFYDFFQSYYGWRKIQVMPWIFRPHGSKNLLDAGALHGNGTSNTSWIEWSLDKKLSKTIVLHDQEVFYKDYSVDIYREAQLPEEKPLMWDLMTPEELFLIRWWTCSWPIFCHSEVNSPDIQWLESIGVVECYYFWHGLIARDWFRHWRHTADLQHKSAWKKRFLLYIRECTGTREYRAEVKERLAGLKDQIDSDWAGIKGITSDYSAKIVVEDAVNTAIHLVAETIFGSDKIHVTEKTFKPMVMRQPFIIFGGPGTLQYLRKYGFRTFGDIWDESYDLVADEAIRMNKIVELITHLYQLPESEFQAVIERCQSIVEHNQQWFFSDQFEKIMLDELHTNMQTALQDQANRDIVDPGGAAFFVVDSLRKKNVPGVAGDNEVMQIVRTLANGIKSTDPARYQRIEMRYPWVRDLI